MKNALRKEGFSFEEEFNPLTGSAYSVDIAFPERRLAVEVNGEQHYERDGSLRSYYQKRHEEVENAGWNVIELHYARCYGDNLQETLAMIKNKLA